MCRGLAVEIEGGAYRYAGPPESKKAAEEARRSIVNAARGTGSKRSDGSDKKPSPIST